jgi:XTP/dITP diphosphohydrolase
MLVISTQNPNKAREFRLLLCSGPWQVRDLSQYAGVELAAEAGSSYAENAQAKARQAAIACQVWALGDDTGLEVDALGGAPGIHSARFAGESATPEANRTLLLERLRAVADEDRAARFVCCLALANPEGHIVAEANGDCRGRIRRGASGSGGFGYDRLFELVEYHVTLAELGDAAASCLTHRARAVQAMWPQLRRYVADESHRVVRGK